MKSSKWWLLFTALSVIGMIAACGDKNDGALTIMMFSSLPYDFHNTMMTELEEIVNDGTTLT
ncbi:hypothetical protein HXZ66_04465 [Bacillus sp. A116_S68]|nr:hypothetical protein HXZ66_04465 [Bacillus sp. A116_S68]